MNSSKYERERKRHDRLERLGSNNPECLFCPENDPCCLELHHLSGKAFGNDCIVVCRNCHRKLSDRQKEHPTAIAGEPNTV
jgi:5-methylcytosine-specific restriction endonuclease McrA